MAGKKNLVGKVCECSIGRPGVVTGKKKLPWGMAWVGDGLDGKGPWSSRKPKVLFDSVEEYEASLEDA